MSAGAFRCGHARVSTNIYRDSKGSPRCRECKLDNQRSYMRARRDGQPYQPAVYGPDIKHGDYMEAGSRELLKAICLNHPYIFQRAA